MAESLEIISGPENIFLGCGSVLKRYRISNEFVFRDFSISCTRISVSFVINNNATVVNADCSPSLQLANNCTQNFSLKRLW